MSQLYTIADLEEAEANYREGDTGNHSNPGRTRRKHEMQRERVSTIRQQLIERGLITKDRPFQGPR
jgi:hypothetical protein